MLKSAAIIAVPGVLGGVGLLYDQTEDLLLQDPIRSGYVVEVGVVFNPSAVRSALPDGLTPAPGHTGGVAIYGGEEGWALSPLSTGYVWIDLVPSDGETSARYLLQAFTADELTPATISLDEGLPGETPESEDDLLHAMASPDRETILDLVVRLTRGGCASGLPVARSDLLTTGPGGSLGVIHMPVVFELCEAEPITARISAPDGHVLRDFAPEHVLWAGVATPLGRALPALPIH